MGDAKRRIGGNWVALNAKKDQNDAWQTTPVYKRVDGQWTTRLDREMMEGVPPLTFTANGEPLVQYQIYGSVDGVGEKTISDDYKIPVVCGGTTTDIYIGSAPLYADEYVDYQEGEKYIRPKITNILPYAAQQDTNITKEGETYRIKKGTKIVNYESVKLNSSIAGDVAFTCKVNISSITRYGLRVCFRNSSNAIIKSAEIIYEPGEYSVSVEMDSVPSGSIVCFMYNGQGTAPSSQTFDFTAFDMVLSQGNTVALPAIPTLTSSTSFSVSTTNVPENVKIVYDTSPLV